MFYRIQILGVVLLVIFLAGCSGEPAAANDPAQQTSVQTVSDTTDQQQPAETTSNQDNTGLVARVNDVPITQADYEAELARRLENSSASDPQAVAAQVLDGMVEQELIEQAAPVLGVSVTDDDVAAEIAALRAGLSEDEWQAAMALNGYTNEADFAEAQRKALLAQRVRDAVLAPLNGDIVQVHARHIVVRTEQQANDILARLENGEAFETLAQELSIDVTTKDRGGDLGWFTANELMDERLSDVAFGLEPGQIAGPIPTLIGYHVIQVIERAERPVEPERLPLLMENVFMSWLDGQFRAAIIERYR
ncbi:MAG: peptidylprolyl isomerase [Anaerolineae bacterium]|nr:peptidylprolyl isomerase [Anaerolineae bacterium]